MENQRHVDEEFPDSSSGCGCFNLFRPFMPLRTNEDQQQNRNHQKRQPFAETTKSWWSNQTRKAKEFSEVIAGPKWKNFIRRVGGYFNGGRKKQSKTRFQYDPQSYALNFEDSGFGREDEDQDQEEEEGLLVR